MFDVWDLNAKIQITYALLLIVFLLLWLAFFKDTPTSKKNKD